MIYFDNAATSWPKPPEVGEAVLHFLNEIGANPGRAGHRLSIESSRILYETRERVASVFHAADPMQVIFGANVTEGLNLALHGLLRPGDHVITSSMEHNSVMRPLRDLEAQGVELTIVPCTPEGLLNPQAVENAIRPNTVMIAVNHASNVIGTLQPINALGKIARKHDLLFLVDCAQTGGAYPIDMEASQIDLLGFTGHKSLYGPMGTGGLIIGERVQLEKFRSLKQGGTGSRSEAEFQPEFLPDKFESGTPNTVGLAGLNAALGWLLREGIENIRTHETLLTQTLIDGLKAVPGIRVYGSGDASRQTATVSFNLQNMDPSEASLLLDENYGILCRVGLHCAPIAHKTIGTFPGGTIRFGLGYFNTLREVNQALNAVEELSKRRI